ncbi:CRAL/TRIO domain-containing protein [Mycena venus]|uniref:CRAL/TRIO domain-containing protein n=1 Tax=Mycena venus TaxID=2733690 RepID=A0A8H6YW85_9AGAR|nr:CRAL/TRIO domain-containing protein [Mycena venus]
MGDSGTYNIFTGHLGHLSSSQEEALVAFKRQLAEAKLYDPEQPSLDDPTLLRFLRARSFSVAGALKQFSDFDKWRREHDVDNLYTTFDSAELENSRRFYPRWTGRRDKASNSPLFSAVHFMVHRMACLSTCTTSRPWIPPSRRNCMPHHPNAATNGCGYSYCLQLNPNNIKPTSIALYEWMVRFTLPLCSFLPHPTETPITCVVTIIDLQDVSIGSMWTLRSHLSESAKLATANYPETLSTIAIVNAPSFFPTIWGWIKGWFDPGTRNKIHILGKNPAETLLKLIDAQDLPRQYGGTLEWEFADEPSLDDATKQAIGEMPKGPTVFVDGKVAKP